MQWNRHNAISFIQTLHPPNLTFLLLYHHQDIINLIQKQDWSLNFR
jgi:hypothetical protein